MNSGETHRLLALNLVHTYCELARGLPGTEVFKAPHWTAATNAFPHPICNFAVCDNTEDLDASDIFRLASGRRHFNVYVCRASGEPAKDANLRSANFLPVYTLTEMAFEGPPQGKPAQLNLVDNPLRRKQLSEFMTWQFFSTQSPPVREKIACATAGASGLKAYEFRTESVAHPAGAVMLSRSEGMVGLYNLCVDMGLRSRGYGSSIVFGVQAMARLENVIVGLQCDSKLISWYSMLGFKEVGSIAIYGLDFGVKL